MFYRFFSSTAEIFKFFESISILQCPHCMKSGFFKRHSKIYRIFNKSEFNGQRLFCSDRGKNKGCGKTIPILLATYLPSTKFYVSYIWDFFKHYSCDKTIISSWEEAGYNAYVKSPYKFVQKIKQSFSKTKTLLSSICKPPVAQYSKSIFVIYNHLIKAFPHSNNPLKEFIIRFNTSII